MLLKMLQHVFKRKYSTPSSSSSAHIITKPDSSNKSPSESGWFTAKCNSIPLLLPAHYHMSPTNTIYMYTNTIYMYTWSTKWEKMVSIVVWSNYYCQESILFYCLHTFCKNLTKSCLPWSFLYLQRLLEKISISLFCDKYFSSRL